MKRKFRYVFGQWLNNLTGFTTFLESESERRAYEILRKTGYTIKKQYRIDPYRLDFYMPYVQINIEIDGIEHSRRVQSDHNRDKALGRIGIRTLRIPASELYKKNYEKMILKKLKEIISKPIL